MSDERDVRRPGESGLTRAELLRRAAGGAVLLSVSGLIAACGSSGSSGSASSATSSRSAATGAAKSGGHLRIGATGGGARTGSTPTRRPPTRTSFASPRCMSRSPSRRATSRRHRDGACGVIEPVNGRRGHVGHPAEPGIEFHNGKTLSADDVIFSLKRITQSEEPGDGAASIGYVNLGGHEEDRRARPSVSR